MSRPENAAMMFGEIPVESAEPLEIAFAGLRTIIVGDTRHDGSARRAALQRLCKQRARFIALPGRQHQHQRMKHRSVRLRRIGHRPSRALQRIRIRFEALLADQAQPRLLAQRPAVARAQE
jgi:hypothetical protein